MKEQALAFWTWFEANNKPFLFLADMAEEQKSKYMTEMMEHLHQYSDHLGFEIGGTPGGDLELVITAEGNAAYFSDVKTLFQAAPTIPNWKLIAFVPPRGTDVAINFEDYELKTEDIFFLPMENPMHPDALGLKIKLPNYDAIKEFGWLQSAIFKILECILGEQSFALDVQHVDLSPLPSAKEDAVMLPLSQLQAFIAWRKAQQAKMILLN